MPLPSIIDVSNSGVGPLQIQIRGSGTAAADGIYLKTGSSPDEYTQVTDSLYVITANDVTPASVTQWDLEYNVATLLYTYDVTGAGNGIYCIGSWDVSAGTAPAPSSIATQLIPSQLTPS